LIQSGAISPTAFLGNDQEQGNEDEGNDDEAQDEGGMDEDTQPATQYIGPNGEVLTPEEVQKWLQSGLSSTDVQEGDEANVNEAHDEVEEDEAGNEDEGKDDEGKDEDAQPITQYIGPNGEVLTPEEVQKLLEAGGVTLPTSGLGVEQGEEAEENAEDGRVEAVNAGEETTDNQFLNLNDLTIGNLQDLLKSVGVTAVQGDVDDDNYDQRDYQRYNNYGNNNNKGLGLSFSLGGLAFDFDLGSLVNLVFNTDNDYEYSDDDNRNYDEVCYDEDEDRRRGNNDLNGRRKNHYYD